MPNMKNKYSPLKASMVIILHKLTIIFVSWFCENILIRIEDWFDDHLMEAYNNWYVGLVTNLQKYGISRLKVHSMHVDYKCGRSAH